jgi:hypothetical protein
MSLELTLAIIAAFVVLLVFSAYMDHRPRELGKVEMIPYKGLMFLSILLIIVLLAHVVSLLTGAPVYGRTGF